jgi:hypothetical protein
MLRRINRVLNTEPGLPEVVFVATLLLLFVLWIR